MKTKLLIFALCFLFVFASASAESWPVYYQPTVGPSTPTPVAYSAMLIGGYGDYRAQSDYHDYHTGIDFGCSVPPGPTPPTLLTDYIAFPVVPGIIDFIERQGYSSRLDIISGNQVYSYGHLIIDDSLSEQTPVAISTPLGRVCQTGGEPMPHLHLALFDSKDMDVPIQNLLDHFGSGLTINSNPQVIFDPADAYSGITFFSDDASGSINHLCKVVSGKVDILAKVHHYASGSTDPAGIQWIGYKIYKGVLPTAESPKQPVHEAILLNAHALNGSINGKDYRPIDYDRYHTPLPTVEAEVIYARDDDYMVYVNSILRDYRTDDDPYSGLRFIYIVTNNADPTPTRGNPEYLSKNGCWDTTELDDNNCPKFPPGVYTVVIEARDYSGNHRTADADSNTAVWVDSNAKNSKEAGVFYIVDEDNTSGPWDGSFENPFQTITDALTITPLARLSEINCKQAK